MLSNAAPRDSDGAASSTPLGSIRGRPLQSVFSHGESVVAMVRIQGKAELANLTQALIAARHLLQEECRKASSGSAGSVEGAGDSISPKIKAAEARVEELVCLQA